MRLPSPLDFHRFNARTPLYTLLTYLQMSKPKKTHWLTILLCSETQKKGFVDPDVTCKFSIANDLCNLTLRAALLLMQVLATGAERRPDSVSLKKARSSGQHAGSRDPAQPGVAAQEEGARHAQEDRCRPTKTETAANTR